LTELAEENPREELGDDGLDAGRGQRDRRVFAGRAAAEVFPADDDLIVREKLVLGVERHVALGEAGVGLGDARQGVLAELLVLRGDRRVEASGTARG